MQYIKVKCVVHVAAVSCSLNTPRLGGAKLGLGLTGKLGLAWVGAWHGALAFMGVCSHVVGGRINACVTSLIVKLGNGSQPVLRGPQLLSKH